MTMTSSGNSAGTSTSRIPVTSRSGISSSSRSRRDPTTAAVVVFDRPEVQTSRDRKRKWRRTKTPGRRRCWCSVACGPCARSARAGTGMTLRTGYSAGYSGESVRRPRTTRRPGRGQASSTRQVSSWSRLTWWPGKAVQRRRPPTRGG